MNINTINEISIIDISDIDEIKKKVIEKVERGSDPNIILIDVLKNQHLSRGNKLKIARYLVSKGANRSLIINNGDSLARGKRSKKRTLRTLRKANKRGNKRGNKKSRKLK